MKLMVTGFEPFGGEQRNPSNEIVMQLPEKIEQADLVKLVLPVDFSRADQMLREAVRDERPDVILSIGQAGGRAGITVEKVAINYADGIAGYKDTAGFVDPIICENGETAYFSELPVKAMVRAIRDCGIPATLSFSAGTYVCNYIFYLASWLSHHTNCGMKCGFIHVPFLPEQGIGKGTGTPTMALDAMQRGVNAALRTICCYEQDIFAVEGTDR